MYVYHFYSSFMKFILVVKPKEELQNGVYFVIKLLLI